MDTAQQATIMSRYLIGKTPTARQLELFDRALATEKSGLDTSFEAALRQPKVIAYIDSYDALFRPDSQLRRRLYLLFSVLEASPDFAPDFLPTTRSPWYLFKIVAIGGRAVFRLLIGFILVKVRGL